MEKPQKAEGRAPSQGARGRRTRNGSAAQNSNAFCQFHLKGKCTKGDDCLFVHADKDEVERQQAARTKAEAETKDAQGAPTTAGVTRVVSPNKISTSPRAGVNAGAAGSCMDCKPRN